MRPAWGAVPDWRAQGCPWRLCWARMAQGVNPLTSSELLLRLGLLFSESPRQRESPNARKLDAGGQARHACGYGSCSLKPLPVGPSSACLQGGNSPHVAVCGLAGVDQKGKPSHLLSHMASRGNWKASCCNGCGRTKPVPYKQDVAGSKPASGIAGCHVRSGL